jgi:hypothetical protein
MAGPSSADRVTGDVSRRFGARTVDLLFRDVQPGLVSRFAAAMRSAKVLAAAALVPDKTCW